VTDRPTPLTLGFLTALTDTNGTVGGYLVTNAWGRPLEFRLTSAVQPNKVQQILYGSSLAEYIYADLIGKTLVEKTSTTPTLLLTDTPELLPVHSRVSIPILAVVPILDGIALNSPRGSTVYLPGNLDASRATVEQRLAQLDPAVDPSEPFTRVREALLEARKPGVLNRAA
jgi:hypothetical protein